MGGRAEPKGDQRGKPSVFPHECGGRFLHRDNRNADGEIIGPAGHALAGTRFRTPATIAAYQRDACELYERAVRDGRQDGDNLDGTSMCDGIVDLIAWFQSQDGRWAPATIRRHRSAIACWIETVLAFSPDHTREDVAEAMSRALDLDAGPIPKDGGAPKETSSRKRRTLSPEEHRRILYELTPRSGPGGPRADRATTLCRLLVEYLPHLALRPIEVHGANVETRDHDATGAGAPSRISPEPSAPDGASEGLAFILNLVTAKATNGRGNGCFRTLDLSAYDPRERRQVEVMLALAADLLNEDVCPDLLHARLSERLARACDRARVRRVCFYTLRHQALATAKAHGPIEEASALAGHGVTRTVTESYAKARSGWKTSPRVKATPDNVARVRDNARRYGERMTPANRASVPRRP